MKPDLYKKLRYNKPKKYRKQHIRPYGYSSLIDTLEKNEIKELDHWMISELCISGKCQVLDKRNKELADSIYYEIIDFEDGHGGETLNFADFKPFFIVEIYSSIAWPDFDCMTEDEIKNWNK